MSEDSYQKRPIMCSEGHDIEWLTEHCGLCAKGEKWECWQGTNSRYSIGRGWEVHLYEVILLALDVPALKNRLREAHETIASLRQEVAALAKAQEVSG